MKTKYTYYLADKRFWRGSSKGFKFLGGDKISHWLPLASHYLTISPDARRLSRIYVTLQQLDRICAPNT